MNQAVQNIDDALKELVNNYVNHLPAKLVEIQWLLKTVIKEKLWQEQAAKDCTRYIHNLAGSGATFGFEHISTHAKNLEKLLNKFIEDKKCPNSEEESTIIKLYNNLKNSVTELKKSEPEPKSKSNKPEFAERIQQHDSIKNSLSQTTHSVEILSDSITEANIIAKQLQTFGYLVREHKNLESLYAILNSQPAEVVIADIQFFNKNNQRYTENAAIDWHNTNLILLSNANDIHTRLEAIHAGARFFIQKPVDTNILVQKIDSIYSPAGEDPFRILIVDDSANLSEYFALTLQGAGMNPMIINNPLKIDQALIDHNPDLILMDMYMPQCTGMELAQVIRQQDAYVSVPIVYLSAETRTEKQIEAMKLGADDFLTKPIQPDHLISAVSSRVKRYRILRSLMVRDSLTGLLNHTSIKERLEAEIARAYRDKQPLSFAMVDIDNFKSINDRYGHPIGDRVIVSLSQLLRQRLRRSDSVGRYGGEEFGIILPNTSEKNAIQAMETIRNLFASIVQQYMDDTFSVTFSCGIASSEDFDSASRLTEAADKALYEAKRQGKNRVVTNKNADGY